MNITDKPLISFVIPAYNSSLYIEDCLESIYSLDMNGYAKEIIVVNDGSTDTTAQVLAHYINTHNGIKVITQTNKGLSCARNAGMAICRGKYICFVDSDDRLSTNASNLPFDVLAESNTDIFSIELFQIENGKRSPYRRYISPYGKIFTPAMEFMRGRNLMPCSVAYIYKSDFLVRNKLQFMQGIYHEDEEFVPRAFALAESFRAFDTDFYDRILREESITTTTDREKQKKKLRDMVSILESHIKLASKDKRLAECMQCKLDYLAVDIIRLLIRQKHDRIFRKEITDKLKTIGYFPFHWRAEWKHILFNIITRIIL